MKILKTKLIIFLLFVFFTDTMPMLPDINFFSSDLFAKSGEGGKVKPVEPVKPVKPTANNDSAAMTLPGESYVDVSVLNNDTYEGSPFISIFSQPGNGSASVVGEKIRYIPNSGFTTGSDSFKYQITDDNGTSGKATVSITVYGPTVEFTAEDDSAEMTLPGESRVTINVLDNDSGNNIHVKSVSTPSHGSAWSNGTTVTYQPSYGYIGTDSFTYSIQEDWTGPTKNATVNVTVNGPPEPAAEDFNVSTDPGTQVTIPVVGDNPDGVTIDWSYSLSPEHGSAWGSGENIVYQPSEDFTNGTDSFTYRLKDTYERTAIGTINVTIAGVEFAAENDTAEMILPGETRVTINVLDNDTGYNIHVISVGTPSHGSAWSNGTTVTYQPSYGYIGTDSFTYSIQQNWTGETVSATVNVTVNGPPEPAAEDFNVSTDPGTQVTIPVVGDNPEGVTIDWSYSLSPEHGSAWGSGENIVYQPAGGFVGTDSFTYRLSDTYARTATGSITVTVGNVPVANNDSASTAQDVPITIDVLSNDTGTSISLNSVTSPTSSGGTAGISNGEISYTPLTGFTGTDTFNYTIIDSSENTATATVTVTVEQEGGGGGEPGDVEIPSDVIEGAPDEVVEVIFNGSGSLVDFIDNLSSDNLGGENNEDIIPVIDLIQYKMLYNKFYTQTGEQEYATISELFGNLAVIRARLEDGDATDTDISDFRTYLTNLSSELNLIPVTPVVREAVPASPIL